MKGEISPWKRSSTQGDSGGKEIVEPNNIKTADEDAFSAPLSADALRVDQTTFLIY
jgi:hypothetical protein